jgi:hypothetical protein
MSLHQNSLETQQISLKLEHYDDIFSDFDIRPYSKRALSVDFLDEIKRASTDKHDDGVELVLHVPETLHNETDETMIQKRLDGHFEKHYHLLLKEKRRVLGLGLTMVVLGIISMIIATLIIFRDPTHDVVLSFLVVFLEPAAWFLLWEGMDQIVFHSKNINPELNFYRTMHKSSGHLYFKTY